MNKILVNRNIIKNNDSDNYIIDKDKITFNKSGNYEIEYVDCSNVKLDIVIKNVNVNLQEVSIDNDIVVNNNYIVDGGTLRVDKFYNNKKVCEDIRVELCLPNSRIDYNFSNICILEEYYKIDIIHKCRDTVSNISNKAIALKNSILEFEINSNVYKDCNGSILDQNTRIVTMGECQAKIFPNMFIDLEDVEARHGSVVGTFKDDQVFYLMSKGINYNEALRLLIKGYILSNVEVNLDVRKKIMDIIEMYWR